MDRLGSAVFIQRLTTNRVALRLKGKLENVRKTIRNSQAMCDASEAKRAGWSVLCLSQPIIANRHTHSRCFHEFRRRALSALDVPGD